MKYFYLFFLIFSAYSFSIGSEKVNDSCPSFLDHEIRILDSQNFENLCKYKNKVIMVVNVASRCGFTYQYENLQKLYSKYNKEDFVILGFPSRDFMFQEYSSEEKVKDFCEANFNISFPMTKIVEVRGDDKHPLYVWLKDSYGIKPKWNFHKILVDKKGNVVESFSSLTKPKSD